MTVVNGKTERRDKTGSAGDNFHALSDGAESESDTGLCQGSHWVWEGTPSPVQSDDVVNSHLSRALEHTDAASSSPIARPWGRDDQTGRLVDGKVGLGPVMDRRHLRPDAILAQDPRFSLRLVIPIIFFVLSMLLVVVQHRL